MAQGRGDVDGSVVFDIKIIPGADHGQNLAGFGIGDQGGAVAHMEIGDFGCFLGDYFFGSFLCFQIKCRFHFNTAIQKFGAELIFLHVVDLGIAALAGLSPHVAAMPAVDELTRVLRAEATEGMANLAARYPHARTLILEGSPRPLILQAAREEDTSLIVMGTLGRTGLSHLVFGSVAEHVVRHSPVPVLTVRQEEPV